MPFMIPPCPTFVLAPAALPSCARAWRHGTAPGSSSSSSSSSRSGGGGGGSRGSRGSRGRGDDDAGAQWTCDARKPQPAREAADDARYRSKIRSRLLGGREATPPGVAEAAEVRRLPDDLDAMEDIIYDRGPLQQRQVKVFGAWLDDAVAGRKAVDERVVVVEEGRKGEQREQGEQGEQVEDVEEDGEEGRSKGQEVFAQAMAAFNKGLYGEAVVLYANAARRVGMASRLGGEYQLWLAQALDAVGKKGEAASVLEGLKRHGDRDVRRVAAELLFIITAAPLQFKPGTFLHIPLLDKNDDSVSPVLMSNFGALKTAHVQKKPEPYSLEWYMEKKRPPKVVDHSKTEAILVAAAIGVTLAFMMLSSPS